MIYWIATFPRIHQVLDLDGVVVVFVIFGCRYVPVRFLLLPRKAGYGVDTG